MKRSEINALMTGALEFIEKNGFRLPPFVYFTPDDWAKAGDEYDEIRKNMLGWDITDFGSCDFEKTGLLLITLRNGNQADPECRKTYAEKIMIVGEDQVTPFHFHFRKMEDIINRGGGNLLVKLYNSTENGELDTEGDVTVLSDGRKYTVPAGTEIRLAPGQSITMTQGLYHTFRGEPGCGKVLVGEVSQVNDDNTDNRFLEKTGRFPPVDEDEPPLHLLAVDYRI